MIPDKDGLDAAEWFLLELATIGIRGKIKVTDDASWDNYIAIEKNYALTYDGYGMITGDPDEKFFGYFTCDAPRNNAGYCNPEVDRLALAQSQEPDPVKRLQLVRQAEKIILEEDVAWAVVRFQKSAWAWWDYVHNVSPESFFNDYNYGRMEEVWKEKQ